MGRLKRVRPGHHHHWYKWYWSHRYATYFYYDIGVRQYYYWHKPSGNYYPVSYFIIFPSVPAKRPPEKDIKGSIQDTDSPPPEPPQEDQPASEKVAKPLPEDDLPDAKKEAEKDDRAKKQAEEDAGRQLNLARMVYLDGKRIIALDRLRDIIKAYPNTKAAQQAKEWLKEW